ncbi:MAG: hypothetical protein F6K19_17250 [Cyanothece sp. SIO1E1]|nr:hypothetical protein [Cyanothece sp. SIO1E1]
MKHNLTTSGQRSINLRTYNYAKAGAYFVTLSTYQFDCLLGDIANGEMQLSPLGEIVQTCWRNLPIHHPYLTLDEFVVMPNHIHGIVVLNDQDFHGEASMGWSDTFGAKTIQSFIRHSLGEGAAKTQFRDLPEIIHQFEDHSSTQVNQIRPAEGAAQKTSIWQYSHQLQIEGAWISDNEVPKEIHTIRNQIDLQRIRRYIRSNPQAWNLDPLNPEQVSISAD